MRLSLAALIVTVNIGFASIAHAQGWTGTVTTISTPVPKLGFFNPAIAVQPNGNAYAVWSDNEEGDIQAARYVAATDSWDAPITLAGPGLFTSAEVALDRSGNAFFVLTRYVSGGGPVAVIRYAPASGTTTTTTLSSNASSFGEIVTDAAGNAMVVWGQFPGIYAARYDSASAVWSSPEKLTGEGSFPRIAIDGLNDVTVAWVRLHSSLDTVQAARFDSSTLTWSPVNDLSEPSVPSENEDQGTWLPVLAADATGNVTVLWARSNGSHTIAQAARFVKATGTWSSVTDLSAPGANAQYTEIATDPTGNVIGLWVRCPGDGPCVIQAARFGASSASWGGALDLPCSSGSPYPLAAFQMDAAGNGIALVPCTRGSEDDIRLEARRYTATSNQWGAPIEVSEAGQAAYNPDIGFDAAGNAIALWFQIVRVPTGRLGAIQSTRWVEVPPVPPNPPTDLIVSSVIGNTVTLAWKPSSSSTLTEYVLEGGLSPGSVLGSIKTGDSATRFTFEAPSGVFFVRTHALSGNLRSAASNEIQLVVNQPLPPSAPAALLGLANGSRLGLSWTSTFQGGVPTALQLHVTGAQTTTIPLGVSDTFSFDGVPAGTYTFTLTASNAAGVGSPSNAVTLTFPGSCSGPPGVPTYVAVQKSGSSLTLTWHPPIAGTAVTHYVIHVSGALTGSVPTVSRSMGGTVGPGTYSLSVVAANECGTSAPSEVITVTVP
jgi:hypothetical protein